MGMWIKLALAWIACVAPLICGATELQDKLALRAVVERAWQEERFADIEKMYSDFEARDARFPGGTLLSNEVLYGLDDVARQPERSPPPGSMPPPVSSKERHYRFLSEKTGRWRTALPGSTLAVYTLSSVYVSQGFLYRGAAASRDTDKQQMDRFHEYVEKAQALWTEASLERNSTWYIGVLSLATVAGMPRAALASLIDEASDKYPHNYLIYFAAASALQPKWGGSVEAYDWLADLALRKTRAASGESVYARIYWVISDFEQDNVFLATHAQWKRMKPAFDDIIKQYPSAWNLNKYTWFSCLARDSATAKALFKRIDNNLDPDLWKTYEYLARCRRMADDNP